MEEIVAGIVKAFINAGPIGLLALGEAIAIIVLVRWIKSDRQTLNEIQERRVVERDKMVTALQSAADGFEDFGRLTPQVVEALRILHEIKEMILPSEAPPRKRR